MVGTLNDSGEIFTSHHAAMNREAADVEGRWPFRRLRPARLTMASLAIPTIEFVCIAATAFFAAIAYHSLAYTPVDFIRYAAASLFIGLTEVCFAATLGQFSHVQKLRRITFAWSGLGSVAITFLLITSLLFFFRLSDSYSGGMLILQFLSCFIVVVAVRLGTYNRFQSAAAQGFIKGQRVVLVGNRDDCAQYARQLRKSGGGIQIAFSSITSRHESGIDWSITSPIIERCRLLRADSIILLVDKGHEDETISTLASCLREVPADIYAVPTHGARFWSTGRPAEIGGVAAFDLSLRPLSIFECAIKRFFDIIAATAGLIILSPLLLLACAAVALDSRGPIFFGQIRHGYNNRPIRVLKFRTMYVTEENEFRQVSKNDSRVTRIGRLFRVTGIDELPQLWNILCGEMSIVGPRPHAIPHNELFITRIESFCRRHTVKPGLTGWAQVNGFRGETDTLEKMQKRIDHDLYYVDNWSLLFDLKIIVLTLFSAKTYTNAR